jgi:UDP-glucose 4-epimerase
MSGGTTLVTGATGFVGGRVLQPGDSPLVRVPRGMNNEIIGDLGDMRSLLRACEGVVQIFHCAGHAHAFSSSDPDLHRQINLEGTKNLLTAAGRSGVKRFIFLSSVKAMAEPGKECVDEDWPGEPATAYGVAKRAAEAEVLEAGVIYGMHVVNLRLAMVYGRGGRGNLERMARGIRGGWFPPIPETHNRRSLVHVSDVVDLIRLAAMRSEANGQTYIVADPVTYSGCEIYDAIRETLAGSSRLDPRWRIPAGLMRAGGRFGDLLGILLKRSFSLNSELIGRLLDSGCYSPARIEKDLGWRARVSLKSGLQEMLSNEALV